ncbi:MAG: C25 family cysteine peptidase [Candidatus Marinimicrobia bacterium]|jgi:parallel beta-helix repeat protein|nr:C25 family cysteine peptidase [Candidatus Neomarinimicrobiota bacterium]
MKNKLFKALFTVLLITSLLIAAENTENYLIIYHSAFADPAGWQSDLRTLLEDQGHEVTFYSIGNGVGSADIQNMIAVFINMEYPHVKYILLVGKGKDNAIPTGEEYPVANHIANSSYGNYIPFYYYNNNHYWAGATIDIPSDQQYVAGYDIQIGRIPVESITEINHWVSKLDDYYKSFSVYSSYKNRIRHFSQNNDNIDNHCLGYQAELKIEGSKVLHIDTLKYDFIANYMSDIHDSIHCVHTAAADALFRTKIEEGAGITIVSGTGGDPFNFAGFFFPPGISSYSFSNAKPNFIFGNTCSIGNTSHPGYTGNDDETVLENLLLTSGNGIVGAYAPTVNIGTHSSYVADHIYSGLLMDKGMRYVGDIADAFQAIADTITSINYLDLNLSILRKTYNSDRHDYHYKSMVLYGDPSMPLSLYQYVNSDITENTVWSGSIIVENVISISPGAKLTIQPGTGVFFKNGAELNVYGRLIAEGTSSYPIVFTAASESPSPGDWEGIRFDYAGPSRIVNCKIMYGEVGIGCNYSSNLVIENDTISHCICGIGFYYSSPENISSNYITQNQRGIYGVESSPVLTNNTITNCSDKGIYFYLNSSPVLYNNTIEASDCGAYFYYQCYPDFGPVSGSEKGNNLIRNNSQGLYVTNYSEAFLGASTSYNDRVGGYNAVFTSSGYNTYSRFSSSVMAHWCWWGAVPPSAVQFTHDATSTISYSNYLSSLPSNIGSSLSKAAVASPTSSDNENDIYSKAGFDPRKPNPNKLSDLWLWAYDLTINGKNEDAIEVYQILINKFPEDNLAKLSLAKMSKLYEKSEKNTFKQYLNSLSTKADKNLAPAVYSSLLTYYAQNVEIDEAIRTGENILKEYPDTEEEMVALFTLITLESSSKHNADKANEYLKIMKQKYPYQEMTLLAREFMGEKVDWELLNIQSLKKQTEEKLTDASIPEKYKLHQNYPNPFNPVTTIEYDLPEAAAVSLVIYDVTGKEVARLINTQISSGYHQIIWNGLDKNYTPVASGVYIYRLKTDKFCDVKKMLLVR